MIHPQDRAQRKRLAEAKALASPLYHQRKINPKKRKLIVEILDKETNHALDYTDHEFNDSY